MRQQFFILTRFNVRMGEQFGRGLAPEWLSHRLTLFKNYCLPSVQSQGEKDFTWLLFCDPATPSTLWDELEPCVCCFIPVRPDQTLLECCQEAIRSRLRAQTTHVVTTRLDNDDAIASDFVARLKSEAAFYSRCILNFSHGFQLYNRRLYTVEHASNPFLSLVEPVDQLQTVFAFQHGEAGNFAPVVQIVGAPAWIQVVHSENISNGVSGIRTPLSHLLGSDRFVLKIPGPEIPEPEWKVSLDRMLSWSRRVHRFQRWIRRQRKRLTAGKRLV